MGRIRAEIKETLTELDRQVARLLETLDKKAGPGRSVVTVTADHGMPPEPAPGHRHYPEDIVALINQRFDPAGKTLVQSYCDCRQQPALHRQDAAAVAGALAEGHGGLPRVARDVRGGVHRGRDLGRAGEAAAR